jgi:septin 3/9/12
MATTMTAQQMQSVFPKSHVGFDSITNQIEKKLLKRGFQFNVICVGMSHHSKMRSGLVNSNCCSMEGAIDSLHAIDIHPLTTI